MFLLLKSCNLLAFWTEIGLVIHFYIFLTIKLDPVQFDVYLLLAILVILVILVISNLGDISYW